MQQLFRQFLVDSHSKTYTVQQYTEIVNRINGQEEKLREAISQEKVPKEIHYFPCDFKIQEIDSQEGPEVNRAEIPPFICLLGSRISGFTYGYLFPWNRQWVIEGKQEWERGQNYRHATEVGVRPDFAHSRVLQSLIGDVKEP